jgi:hypothetical protein
MNARTRADAGYGKADFLTWLENRGISPYIPLRLHYPSGNQLYGLDGFTYQPETNSFECPEGKQLKYRGIKPAANRSHIYRSTEAQSHGGSKKEECTSGRYKQLVIVDEEVRQRARLRNQEPDFFRHQQQEENRDTFWRAEESDLPPPCSTTEAKARARAVPYGCYRPELEASGSIPCIEAIGQEATSQSRIRVEVSSTVRTIQDRNRTSPSAPIFQQLQNKWTPDGTLH